MVDADTRWRFHARLGIDIHLPDLEPHQPLEIEISAIGFAMEGDFSHRRPGYNKFLDTPQLLSIE